MSISQFVSASFFLVAVVPFGCLLSAFSGGVNLVNGLGFVDGGWLIFDSLAFYLIILVILLGGLSLVCFFNQTSYETKLFLTLSLFFSCLCFCVNHAIIFWCFYELSMLPLLFLIFKDSPYSERFLAGWYFAVYLIVTSLPLLLCLLFLVCVNSSFYFSDWGLKAAPSVVYFILCFIFFTKVPLSPFHTWLPIVHAEATSIVSIFLSGYIMKLGLLGVYRCSAFMFNGDFCVYLFFCCVSSICFIITASSELDGKRWLAFLSLSHIVVGFVCFFVCDWETISLGFIYCLGHGLSAGLVFGLLWAFYEVTFSRNWLLLKSGIGGKSVMLFCVVSLLSLCSFPPTLQFFCEVSLLGQSSISWLILLFWVGYLFLGGLIPLTLCGHLLIRSCSVENSSYSICNFFVYLFCLALWCYAGIFVL
uniref:NADH-ubiquinone oxidoreductase chain 4 n=1 Tax=Rhinebothrium fulbrighti TaxID=1008294 RepID=A0A8K1SY33_9CEST|nr:NADH dehydrogenase subunit 4 [Rhinebothrium fulbrighti]